MFLNFFYVSFSYIVQYDTGYGYGYMKKFPIFMPH